MSIKLILFYIETAFPMLAQNKISKIVNPICVFGCVKIE